LIVNLRDVGGCTTGEGRPIARGVLYRSAEFAWHPDSAARRTLTDLGIRRVIDLRTESEIGETDGTSAIERAHVPLLAESTLQSFPPSLDRSPSATAARYYDFLLEGRPRVVEIVRTLTTARSRPTLIHCVAGRDRTGIVIACVLSLLDVPEDAIARDYAESHVMDDAEGRNAHPDNLRHLLGLVRERHGSVASLLGDDPSGALPLDQLRHALLD
jgi:hypothetical protein